MKRAFALAVPMLLMSVAAFAQNATDTGAPCRACRCQDR